MSTESHVETPHRLDEEPHLSLDGEDDLQQRLEQIRIDVERGRVPEARVAVKELEARWPESPRVQYWARVLALPTSRVVTEPDPRSRPRDRERAWLREHAHEYPGCWLAVFEDRLIAADPDLEVVLTEADRTPEGQHSVLYMQPIEPEPK
jgi:hypothetical protein